MYNDRVSIQDLTLKFKGAITNQEYQLTALIIAVALIAFYLGRVSQDAQYTLIERGSEEVAPAPLRMPTSTAAASQVAAPAAQGNYVASKSGTKYHLPWCSGAQRIKEENKVFFATKEEAEAAGYTPASNCKGI
jgi:hypothetical protein